ncbi:MAG TPA: hypothetical protein VMR76_02070 [Candidatus Saccharimonadia bacterium]|nr:hypothetical protein [Candidatus Saccharimonadia bacterium]
MKLIGRKLSSKGFSHVELTLSIFLIVILGGVGYYVWNHNYSKTTAQAGSWTILGRGKICTDSSCSTFSGYYTGKACKYTNSKNILYVKGAAVADSTFPKGSYAFISGYNGGTVVSTLIWQKLSITYPSAVRTMNIAYHYVSSAHYIQMNTQGSNWEGTPVPLNVTFPISRLSHC